MRRVQVVDATGEVVAQMGVKNFEKISSASFTTTLAAATAQEHIAQDRFGLLHARLGRARHPDPAFGLVLALASQGLINRFFQWRYDTALVFVRITPWVVLRSKLRFRIALDAVAFLPHAVPGIIFALGAVLVALFLLPQWLPLYGSLTLIVLVCATGWIAFGTRVVNASLMQIHSELEEAGLAAGATPEVVAAGPTVMVDALTAALARLQPNGIRGFLKFRDLFIKLGVLDIDGLPLGRGDVGKVTILRLLP